MDPHTEAAATFTVRGERRNGIDRLLVAGALDVSTAPILRRDLDALVHPGGALVLDLCGLTSIDRVGVQTLERAVQFAARKACRLCIVNGHGAVRDAFVMARIDHLLSPIDLADLLDPTDERWVQIPLPPLPRRRESRRPSLTGGRS